MRGTWRKITLATPLAVLPGDVLAREGGVLRQYRGGALLAERPLSPAESHEPLPASEALTLSEVFFFEERRMAVKTITAVSVGGSGVVRVNFSDGNQRELSGGHADGVALADALDANEQLAEDVLIAKAYRHSPDGTSLGDIVGSTCTIDTAAEAPIQVSLAGAML